MNEKIGSVSRFVLFISAIVIGVLCLLFLRQNQGVGLIAIFFVITIYAAVGFKLYRKADRDNHGDSVYYLGFCLTLVSLSIGLIFRNDSEGALALINTFGYGLMATVCGLVLRILIQNFSEQTDIDASHGIDQLREGYLAFGRAIEEATLRVNQSMEAFQDRAERSIHEFTESVSQAADVLRDDLRAESESSLLQLEKITTSSIQAISATSAQAIGAMTHSVSEIVDNAARAASSIGDAGHAISSSSKEFKKGADQVLKSSVSLIEASQAVEELAIKISGAIGKVDNSAALLVRGMDSALGPIREMAEFQKVIYDMKNASSGVEGHMREIHGLVADLATQARRAKVDSENASKEIFRIASSIKAGRLG